jgi:hypothetical protein
MASPFRFNKANIDHLTKSLERLSIYDGHGKVHILQISPKADYIRILGDLDLDTIQEKMYFFQKLTLLAKNSRLSKKNQPSPEI